MPAANSHHNKAGLQALFFCTALNKGILGQDGMFNEQPCFQVLR